MRLRVAAASMLAWALASPATLASAPAITSEPDCHVGAYRNSHGDLLALGTTATAGTLRYYFVDGRTGLLRAGAAHEYTAGPGWESAAPVVARAQLGSCGSRQIAFALKGEPKGRWNRIPLVLTHTRFASHGITLEGRLVEPAGGKPKPAVVLVQGSLDTPSLDREPWQW